MKSYDSVAIVCFAYKRPIHLKACLEYLSKNIEAKNIPLVIYVDGSKNNKDKIKRDKVIKLAQKTKGFLSVTLIERNKNLGLYLSLTSGITEILHSYEKAIIIEDDILVSPYFLKYMIDALNLYKEEKDVVSIHGYRPPIKYDFPETFFLRGADCWGWATWRDRWQLFRGDAQNMIKELEELGLTKKFNYLNSYDYSGMLNDKISGRNNSWAICWHSSCFLKNKLTLHPGQSLVQNIGLDNSGENCKPSKMMESNVINRPIDLRKIKIIENKEIYKIYSRYYQSHKIFLKSKISRFIYIIKQKNFISIFSNFIITKFNLSEFILHFDIVKKKLISKKFIKYAYYLKSIFFKSKLNLIGPFKNFETARNNSQGYEDAVILQKVKKAIIEVLENNKIWERDGTIFFTKKPKQRILEILKKYVKKETFILDIGGGLGGLYINNRELFNIKNDFYILEQENFVQCGRDISEKYKLPIKFITSIDMMKFTPNIVIFSSVLQYLPEVHNLIEEVKKLSPNYIIIDRTWFTNSKDKKWWVQRTKNYYSKTCSYPIRPINIELLLNHLSNYKIIDNWQNSFDVSFPPHKGLLLKNINI